MNKKLLILSGILAVALIILAAFYFSKQKNTPKAPENFEVTKTNLEEGKLASGFPQDLPIEVGSETKQSYEATSKDGRKQSTITITTKKSLSEAVNVYKAFFANLGWREIPVPPANPEFPEATFRKDDNVLLITTLVDETTKVNTIDLTLTESKK